MTQPEEFLAYDFPQVAANNIVCIGTQLSQDMDGWKRAAAPFVTAKEQQHAQRFVRPIDAVRHLIGRAIVRRTLAAATGQKTATRHKATTDFLYTKWGKPYCPDSDIHFSISHSGQMVWTAFSRVSPVGIDVEEKQPIPDMLKLAELFHPQEYEALQKLSKAQQAETERAKIEMTEVFYRCWVRKEAVIKAGGKGLSQPLQSFCVHTGIQKKQWLKHVEGDQTSTWMTQDIETHNAYHCSVAATAKHTNTITLFI